jgi:two-component system LytT family response regulator
MSDALRIVIADDEPAARRRLTRLVEAEPNFTIVGEFADGRSAVDGIRHLRPDVALLDIQMPEYNGLEVAQMVSDSPAPAIVFVTAFDHYALQAFEVHAVDYLVKPIAADRLHKTLTRLREKAIDPQRSSVDFARLARMIEELGSKRREHASGRLLVAADGRSIVVPVEELDWIEASGNYVRLHRGSSTLTMRESLASIEAGLDAATFARIHRRAIVNITKVREIEPALSGSATVILVSGERLPVSRSHRASFEARFGITGA